MLDQLLSMVGAVLVLAAYALLQKGKLKPEQPVYSWLNFVGAGLLTVVAVRDQRAGFIVLEGAWALLSAWPLVRRR